MSLSFTGPYMHLLSLYSSIVLAKNSNSFTVSLYSFSPWSTCICSFFVKLTPPFIIWFRNSFLSGLSLNSVAKFHIHPGNLYFCGSPGLLANLPHLSYKPLIISDSNTLSSPDLYFFSCLFFFLFLFPYLVSEAKVFFNFLLNQVLNKGVFIKNKNIIHISHKKKIFLAYILDEYIINMH